MAEIAADTVEGEGRAKQGLILGALGVVFGDIGTSPLYTIKQCFDSIGGGIAPWTVYGVLSLITWALVIIVAL
jgi:KUP system potassium uptake protein